MELKKLQKTLLQSTDRHFKKAMISFKKLTMKRKILFVSSLICIFSLLILPVKLNRERYAYDISKDYAYDIGEQQARLQNFDLKKGVVSFDAGTYAGHTALLKVNIDRSLLGRFVQPSIVIKSKTASITEYIEHGGSGVRYLNISPLMSNGDMQLTLEANHLNIKDQSVQLAIFEKSVLKTPRVLVLAPHPDDAEIAAFGFYSRNKDSYIVTITAGDGGSNTYDELYKSTKQQYLKKGMIRTWNSIAVPMLGKVHPERALNLGYFDGTLKMMFDHKNKQVRGVETHTSDMSTYRQLNVSSLAAGLHGKANWRSLVDNLKYLLNEIKPDIIVSPYPALDSHNDHKYTSIALFEALRALPIKKGQLYFYTNHLVVNEYYPHGDIGGVVSLPPNFDQSVYFDGLYSHALNDEQQDDKLLALDAMNDLRLDTEWRFPIMALRIAAGRILRKIGLKQDVGYYRRAIRRNELFFTVKIDSLYDERKMKLILGE